MVGTLDAKGIRIFEEKHMVSLMLYLEMNGVVRKIDIYQNVSNSPHIPMKLDKLEYSGLVRQYRDPDSKSTLVELTELGKAVASSLASLDKKMKSE